MTADLLERFRLLCEEINRTVFKHPGAFTNAMLSDLSDQGMTRLLKDALPSEKSLYRVSKAPGISSVMLRKPPQLGTAKTISEDVFVSLKPERVDGKTTYIDNGESLAVKSPGVNTAVRVPQAKLSESGEFSHALDELSSSSPSRRRLVAQSRLVPPQVLEGDDVKALCDAMLSVVDQHLGLVGAQAMREKAFAISEEYDELVREMEELEQTVSERKKLLEQRNDDMGVLLPSRYSVSPSLSASIADLIELEVEKIQQLESELAAFK